MQFLGNYPQSMDAKGRVVIPTAFRDGLGVGFTIGLNDQATAAAFYPKAKWESIMQRLSRIRSTDAKGMRYVRYIVGNSFDGFEPDAQGRVLLPPGLRQALDLQRDISFVGMIDYVELWGQSAYESERKLASGGIEDLLGYVNETYGEV